MEIIRSSSAKLREAEYQLRRTDLGLVFEGVAVFGVVQAYPSASELLESWQDTQDQFLDRFRYRIQAARRKSWNAYGVFLTSEDVSDKLAQDLMAIEEDLRATRKIVRPAIKTERDVANALLPLLPLKRRYPLEDQDVMRRLVEETDINQELLSLLYETDDRERHRSMLL